MNGAGLAGQRRATAVRNVASVDTDYYQRPQELGPRPNLVEFYQVDANVTSSQYGGRCALCGQPGKMCAVFDPARDEKVRRTWVTDHDPKYLRQQRNSVFLCYEHFVAFKEYKFVLAPSEEILRRYIQLELDDYEQRRKAAKVGQIKEATYSLETKGLWVEVLPLHHEGFSAPRSVNPILQNLYSKYGDRTIYLPNVTAAVCYFHFLGAMMSLKQSNISVHPSPRLKELRDLLEHYATLRARPDPVPGLKFEQQAVMMEQKVMAAQAAQEKIGPQVSTPAPQDAGKRFSGRSFTMPQKQTPLGPSMERPQSAFPSRERRPSLELGSSLKGLSLGTPPRPGTAAPSHGPHRSLQLPTGYRSRRMSPSPPTSPTSPKSPGALGSMPRMTSPSPQRGASSNLTSRPRRSSFTGGHATYADPCLPSNLQRSLSPLSPQSPTRSLSPSSFASSSSPPSSFSGSPPMSRVTSPDTSPTFGSMNTLKPSRGRMQSFGEYYGSKHQGSATPMPGAQHRGNSLGMAMFANGPGGSRGPGFSSPPPPPRPSTTTGRTFRISR